MSFQYWYTNEILIHVPPQGCPGGSVVKNLPADAGDVGSIPGWGRSLGEGMAAHSRVLAWRIPWTWQPKYLFDEE